MNLSSENQVIGVFVLLALVVSFGTDRLFDLPGEAILAFLIGLGVIAPLLVNERCRR